MTVEGLRVVKPPWELPRRLLQVAAKGEDLAELFYLTQLALPNSPPYSVQAIITRDGEHFTVRDIKGILGSSDIGGTMDKTATSAPRSRSCPVSISRAWVC